MRLLEHWTMTGRTIHREELAPFSKQQQQWHQRAAAKAQGRDQISELLQPVVVRAARFLCARPVGRCWLGSDYSLDQLETQQLTRRGFLRRTELPSYMLFSTNDFTGLGLGKQPPVLRFGVGLDFWSLNRYGLGKRQSARVWLVIPPPPSSSHS